MPLTEYIIISRTFKGMCGSIGSFKRYRNGLLYISTIRLKGSYFIVSLTVGQRAHIESCQLAIKQALVRRFAFLGPRKKGCFFQSSSNRAATIALSMCVGIIRRGVRSLVNYSAATVAGCIVLLPARVYRRRIPAPSQSMQLYTYFRFRRPHCII